MKKKTLVYKNSSEHVTVKGTVQHLSECGSKKKTHTHTKMSANTNSQQQ